MRYQALYHEVLILFQQTGNIAVIAVNHLIDHIPQFPGLLYLRPGFFIDLQLLDFGPLDMQADIRTFNFRNADVKFLFQCPGYLLGQHIIRITMQLICHVRIFFNDFLFLDTVHGNSHMDHKAQVRIPGQVEDSSVPYPKDAGCNPLYYSVI